MPREAEAAQEQELGREVAVALEPGREAVRADQEPVRALVAPARVPAAVGVALAPGQEAVRADQAPVRAAVSVLDLVRRWDQPLDPAPMHRSALVPMLPLVLARMLQSVRVRVLQRPPGLSLASRPEKVRLSAMAPAMGPVTRGLGPKTELVSDQGSESAARWDSVPATEPATRGQVRRTAPASEPLRSVS